MRFRQQRIFGQDDDHVVIDQRAGEDHARFQVFYRNSTQRKSLLADCFLLLYSTSVADSLLFLAKY